MLAGPLMTTLFNYGAFKQHDVVMAQMSLFAYASGLLAFIMIKVLAPGFYARQDTRTPVRIAVVAMLANLILILALVIPWVRLELPAPHTGLAMATSIAAYVNAVMLFLTLRRQGVYHAMPGWSPFLTQLGGALALMLAVLIFAVPGLSHWLAWSAGHRALMLLVWVSVCAATYFAGLYLFGFRLGAFRAQHA